MVDINREGRTNAVTVGVLSLAGGLCFATSFYGRQTPLIEYCFKPTEVKNPQDFCTPDKRYTMPVPFTSPEQQPANPKYQEDWQLPEHATLLRTIPPTNPHKWAWTLSSTVFFGLAYGLSKARERKLLEYLPQHREEVKSSWLLNRIRVSNHQQKVEYAAELDYQLWQFSADRAVRAKQLSMMSPQEIQVYQEQARLQAEAETRVITNSVEPAGLLKGQTLDDVTAPGDKLSGNEAIPFPGQPTIPTISLGLGVRRDNGEPIIITPDGISLASFMIAGKSGSGKSCLVQNLLCSMLDAGTDYYQFFVCEGKADYFQFKDSPHCLGYYSSADLNGSSEILQCILRVRGIINDRIKLFREINATNLAGYNSQRSPSERLPFLYLVCDELMNIFASSDEGQTTFDYLREIACLGRSSGVGLIFVDQRMKGTKNLNLAPIREQVAYAICGLVKGVETSELILGIKDAINLRGKGDFLVATDDDYFRMQAYLVENVGAYIQSDSDGTITDTYPVNNPQTTISLSANISNALSPEMEQALEWLRTHEGWYTAGAIRRGCRKLKEMIELSQVEQVIQRLVEFELVEESEGKYRGL
ncbi:MAG: hypothetical protein F6J89_14430 [Symploca sp. SIO1C4]|uniref:FtsK domain-containing protein n=1 Tax=Symploca sp. SIO1C4 TaxID=2607765 RepID=A0A6B3NDU8_9CYAN|nr:hypothetical protein [Symploca sp. SIO1C4]